MNDNIWLAEDGRLLKDLRTSAGLDILEFARAASISPAQLRQLEEGGNELFYSQSIKFQLGRKLLRKLGADVVRVDEQPAPETPSLFGFSPSPANGSSLEEVLSAAPTPVLPEPVKTRPALKTRWVPVLSGVGVLILAGVFGAQLLSPQADTHRASATPAPQITPVAAPDANTAQAPALSTSLQAPNEAPSAPANAVAAQAVPQPPSDVPAAPKPVANLAGCQWDSGPGNSFMPRGMDKPSTYVHFVVNADASICVQDRNQKVTQVNLKAGEKLTVRGAAPWRIQTRQWADVGVFFQGYRMPVPASATLVTLNPRLEPLAETTAQTN
jgi:transcriptional regulator with XRE-family HTH domain